jgi:RNA polymerase sigma-70 factor (ECF subfamily)
MDNEKAWIEQALAGNQIAFSHLVEAYQAPVFNLAYRILGNVTEAEDAAQEAFVRAWTRLRTFDPERKFSSWILSIVSHYCIDCLRRRHTTQVPLDDLLAQQAFSDPADGPEKVALHREVEANVRDLMLSLPSQYRVVLALRYWQDLSYDEMAVMLSTTESAIKSRLHRARCMMAERMQLLESQAGTGQDGRASLSVPAPTPNREAMQNALSRSN